MLEYTDVLALARGNKILPVCIRLPTSTLARASLQKEKYSRTVQGLKLTQFITITVYNSRMQFMTFLRKGALSHSFAIVR